MSHSTLRAVAVAIAVGAALAVAGAGIPACAAHRAAPARPHERALSPKEQLARAAAAEKRGDLAAAAAGYRQVLAAQPRQVQALAGLERALVAGGHAADAVAAGRAFVNANPGDLRGYRILADAELAAGDKDAADKTLTQLLAIDDQNAAGYAARGRVQVLRGKRAAGVLDLRKAVSLAPDNADFQTSLGSALEQAGKLDEAAIHLRAAIQLEPKDARAHLLLGIVLRSEYKLNLALGEHLEAVAEAPKSARAQFELGITQSQVGDNLAAEQCLHRAVIMAPTNATYWYAYGEIERALKHYRQAIPAYRRVLALDPTQPKARNKLGVVLYYAGQMGAAEVALTEAVERHPNAPYPYFNLGRVYEKGGKDRLAVDAFEKFLRLAPSGDGDIPTAKKELRALRRALRHKR